ncbi:MAG: CAP domain-containing protein [Pyrinomonadaceae bacterium]
MYQYLQKTFLAVFVVTMIAGVAIAQTAERRVRLIGATKNAARPASDAPRRSIELEKSELSEDADIDMLERETFGLINLKRMEKGLGDLSWNKQLSDLAREHSRNMATNGFFSHYGLNGRTVDLRATDQGIIEWRAIGENIAYSKGVQNPTSFAVERWMLSEGHRRNLLSGFWTETGVGVAVTKDGKYFFTQVFLTKKTG